MAHISGNNAQYVTLGVDEEIFAIDVEQVQEILDVCPISRLPNAPLYLLGMIDVRSKTVPVIDLRVKLGLPFAPSAPTSRILVLEVGLKNERKVVMGLLVDRVYEVTPLSEHSLDEVPDIGVRWNSRFIRAIGRRGQAFVIVLNLEHLFSREEAALIASCEEEENLKLEA